MTLEFFRGSRIWSFGDVHDDHRKERDNGEDLDSGLVITLPSHHCLPIETLSK